MKQSESDPRPTPGGWPGVAGLFLVVLATAIAQPGVLIGVPLVLLLSLRGFRDVRTAAALGVVTLIVATGRGDVLWESLWYAERAWAVLLGGWFLALTLWAPSWRVTSRALGAAAGAMAMSAGILAVRSGGWSALDGTFANSVLTDTEATLQAVSALSGSSALSPEMTSLVRDVAAAQVTVFPALLVIESLAALSVAWWVRGRLIGEGDQGLGALRDFRFNDHLVWVLVAGLLLLVAQSGAALVRVGMNAVVLMGALYALRGAAVYLFVSGGISLFGYLILGLMLVLVPPVMLGTAALIGIGDTWLDLRARAAKRAA